MCFGGGGGGSDYKPPVEGTPAPDPDPQRFGQQGGRPVEAGSATVAPNAIGYGKTNDQEAGVTLLSSTRRV